MSATMMKHLTSHALLFATLLALPACAAKDATGPDPEEIDPPVSITLTKPTGGSSRDGAKSNLSGYFWGWDSNGGTGGRVYAETVLGIGINEHAKVTSYVYNTVALEPGRYRLEADIDWRGYLYGVGIAGTGSKSTLVLRVNDGSGKGLVIQTLNSDEFREAALSIGGRRDDGKITRIVDFTLPAGQTGIRIQLELTCETWGGFFSAEAGCLYGNGEVAKFIGLGGYARWTRMVINEQR